MLENAGLVQHKAGNFAQAEVLYLDSLRTKLEYSDEAADTFDPNSHSFEMKCILENYVQWSSSLTAVVSDSDSEASDEGTSTPAASENEIDTLAILLQSLLHLAGFQNKLLPLNIDTLAGSMIRSALQSNKMAKKTLWKAFSKAAGAASSDVDASKFRRGILKARVSGQKQLPKIVTPEKDTTNRGEKTVEEDDDKDIESVPLSRDNWTYAPCSHCGQKFEKLLECTCGRVRYCGRACQVRHWKDGHKNGCMARQKQVCSFCGDQVPSKPLKCTCFNVIYCSGTCQTKHWKAGHSKSCEKFGKKY